MIPALAAILPILAQTLAEKGIPLLSGIFSSAADKGIEKVSELVEEKTGITVRDIAENRLDPNQWDELREFETTSRAEILQAYVALDTNDVERERVAQTDRDSARQMQMAAMNSKDLMAQKFVYGYAGLVTLLSFSFLFYAAFVQDYALHPESKEIVNLIIGFLIGTALTSFIQFFFGSSAGSKSKEEKEQFRALLGDRQ